MAGDRDYVEFFLSETSDVVLETDGVSGDTVLYLYDSSYSLLALDDDGGNGLFSLISQTDLSAGTYYAMVEEYGNNGTIDSYTLSLDVTPSGGPAPEPDLVIESITHTPSNPAPDTTVMFTVTVRNQGTAHAGLFAIGFWSDRLTAPSISDSPEGQEDVVGLSAGASTTVSFSVKAPSAGTYTGWAYADRYDGASEVAESNENNNAGPAGGHSWTVPGGGSSSSSKDCGSWPAGSSGSGVAALTWLLPLACAAAVIRRRSAAT